MHDFQPQPFEGSTTLGYAPMDLVHQELETLITSALLCSDSELAQSVESMHAHLKAHFADEERWMTETKFPATECHATEHSAVLASAATVVMKIEEGDYNVGRSFIKAVSEWFPAHANYLDSALAHWICKQQNGGKPLVFHRNILSIPISQHSVATSPPT
jgi:hemerythrin